MGDDDDATRAQSRDALIDDAIAAAVDLLRDLPEGPATRELRSRAESYRRTVDQWGAVRPTQAQRDALRELVLEMHGRVTAMHRARGGAGPASTPRSDRRR